MTEDHIRATLAQNLYPSACANCNKRVPSQGGYLTGDPGAWRSWCLACYDARDRAAHPARWRLFGMRVAGTVGQVLRTEEHVQARHVSALEMPPWVALISSEEHSGAVARYGRHRRWAWLVREAQEGEGAELRARLAEEEAQRLRERAARETWSALSRAVDGATRTTPPVAEGATLPYPQGEGERQYYGAYWGTTDAVVLEPSGEHLWWLCYNGRDGDYWGANNIAGAYLGRRVSVTPDLRVLYDAAVAAQRAARAGHR
jgi:hypothetical protein